MLTALLAGLGLGLSLIVAIGAQNAFVLRQGLRGEHVGPVVAVCALSDALLIVAGSAGAGALVHRFPTALTVVEIGGAAFLCWYGLAALRRARHPGTLDADEAGSATTLRSAVLTCLSLTWLNPHVYLDTVVLVGSLAAGHGSWRWAFAAGAALASLLWFTGLGYGSRVLRPLFRRPTAWRVLDVAVAVTMFTIATTLLLDRG